MAKVSPARPPCKTFTRIEFYSITNFSPWKVNGERYAHTPRPTFAYARFHGTAFASRVSSSEHAIFHAGCSLRRITHRRSQYTACIGHQCGRCALAGPPRSRLRHVQKDTLGHLRNPCYSEFVIRTPCITRLYGRRVVLNSIIEMYGRTRRHFCH